MIHTVIQYFLMLSFVLLHYNMSICSDTVFPSLLQLQITPVENIITRTEDKTKNSE